MPIETILAVTDLSFRGNRTVYRAATIAAHHRALLKIMHAPQALAGAVAPDAQEYLAELAAQVCTRFGILGKKISTKTQGLQAVAEQAGNADLLVIGEHDEEPITAFFAGQPVERLLRVVPCPVLVVRLDVLHRYRRIVVAVDFTAQSRQLVELASAMDGAAEVELFHALSKVNEGKLRYADVSEQAVKAYHHGCLREAHERMFRLTDSSTARRNRVLSSIGHGDAARQAVVQQQYAGAELLVVGKRRSSALQDFLFGSVAQRVLRWSTSDVLMVPHNVRDEPQALGLATS
jgi:nucleotide-binding universal stress UspA family protein